MTPCVFAPVACRMRRDVLAREPMPPERDAALALLLTRPGAWAHLRDPLARALLAACDAGDPAAWPALMDLMSERGLSDARP